MASFEIIFGKTGNVEIHKITGVTPNTNECLDLTKSYERALGVPIARARVDNTEDVSISADIKAKG